MSSDEVTVKTTPLHEGPHGDKDSEGLKQPADIKPLTNPVADLSGTGAKYQVDETQSTRLSPELKKYNNILPLTKRQLVKYLRKVSRVLYNNITKDQWEKHEEVVVSYANLRASIKGYYEENVDHRDQTDKLILKVVKEAVKEDPTLNKKVLEATKAYTKNSHNITELLSIAETFDFSSLKSLNVGPRLTKIKHTQALMQADLLSLKSDTSKIKSMMTKIFQAFKVINITPPEPQVTQRKGKGITTEEQLEPSSKKLVPLTEEQIQDYLDKEEQIKKAAEEAKMFEMTKTEVIKVVQVEAKKILLDPKIIIIVKSCEKFKKAQDAKHQVLKREHSQKPTLPAPIPKQASSQSLGRKRKHTELEPKIKVPGLECDQSLPEGVPFVNNMVIEELEYGIFFTDMFDDQAFQRWNDIHNVGVDSLVSYLVMILMIKTPENAIFDLNLKKLIAEQPDQEKLQSNKV
ncbi:hypothetical protein Tco_0168249 [Tanacetum coccineum]